MHKKWKTILFTFSIILLGFLREYLFVNINWIYLTLANGRMNAARSEFQFLMEWSTTEIVVLKWILTGLFSILFFLLTYIIVRVYFENQSFNKIVIAVYVGLIALSAVLFIFGKLAGLYETIYGAIRTLMGMVQSFMPLMILSVLFKFLPYANRH